jgi:hypothetical protein
MSHIIVANKKQLGIHEYGDKNGFPGSRLDGCILNFDEQAAHSHFK